MGLFGNDIESITEHNLMVSMEVFNTELCQEFVITEGIDIKQKLKDLIEKARTLIKKFFAFIADKIRGIIAKIKGKNKEVEDKKKEEKEEDNKGDKPEDILDKDESDKEYEANKPKEKEEEKTYHIYYPYANNIVKFNVDGGYVKDTIKSSANQIEDICDKYDITKDGYYFNVDRNKYDKDENFRAKFKEEINNLKNDISDYKNGVSEKVQKFMDEFPYKASYTEDNSNYGFKEADIKYSEREKYTSYYDKVSDAISSALVSIDVYRPGKNPDIYFSSVLDKLEARLGWLDKYDKEQYQDFVTFFNAPIQAIMFAMGELKKMYFQKIIPYYNDLSKFSNEMHEKRFSNKDILLI